MWFEKAFVVDLLVEEKLVIELKAVPALLPAHYTQLLTYLRVMELRHGFLINFGAALFKSGVKKVVNGW